MHGRDPGNGCVWITVLIQERLLGFCSFFIRPTLVWLNLVFENGWHLPCRMRSGLLVEILIWLNERLIRVVV